jgi:HEAT repeat protein
MILPHTNPTRQRGFWLPSLARRVGVVQDPVDDELLDECMGPTSWVLPLTHEVTTMSNRSFLLTRWHFGLVAAVLLASSFAGASGGAEPVDPDQARLYAALLPTDTAGLVHFFQLRARGEPSGGTLNDLIERLRAPAPDARQQACAELVAIGVPALPRLRALVREGGQPAVLAQRCVSAIETDGGALTTAAARLLAQRQPAVAVGVLLAYLPHAENDTVLQELQEALRSVAHDDKGAAATPVVRALGDEHPLRRATAVVILADGDLARHRDALRKLLRDPAPSARLRAALALARADETQAVPTLIALLGEVGDRESRVAIEDYLTDLAGALGPKVKAGDEEPTALQARDAWQRWWHDTEGPGLLDELKKRTKPDVDPDKVQALVRELDDTSFKVRQEAQEELVRLGVPILPLLRQVYRDPPDLEVRNRVRICIEAIETENEKAKQEYLPRLLAVGRVVALRKSPGAAEAILAYLPSQDEDGLREELQKALTAVAFADGEAQPALLKALTDKSGTRRIAAARALCAVPRASHLEKARRLLSDPEPAVRLAVALALADAREPSALPALASQVGQLPADLAGQAEDYLSQLAGEAGPKDLPSGDNNRQKRSVAWASWAETAKGNPAVFGPAATAARDRAGPASSATLHGYTLLVQPQSNTVTELGPDNKPRWTLTGLQVPLDAQVLANQHVLVAEQNRVTERDLRGKILWQKEGIQPLSVQRLPNGNTFIPCNGVLLEVDRAGKEVLRVPLQGVAAAHRLHDGRIVAFDRQNIVQLDRAGKEVKRTPVMVGGAGVNEVLDNGHVLTLSPGMGSLIEFDMDGKELGRFDEQGAAHAFRLPNGHTLLTVAGTKYVELDKKYKPVKETALPAPTFRVKRR